ncbi:hypothetical protein Btru_043194 [Bulinus truncatus]|nr:hypothetical protein Btru_043194 [Bulinus truncatus]
MSNNLLEHSADINKLKEERKFGISKRADCTLNNSSPFLVHVQQALGNTFNPTTNPFGIVNLGIAENKICEELILSKLKSIQEKGESSRLLYYDVNSGSAEMKKTAKKFLQNFFHPLEDIDESNIVIISGTTAALEILAFAVADKGEYIIVPSPFYFRIENDVQERAEAHVLKIPLQYKDDCQPSECIFNSTILEKEYEKATIEGKVIKAILLSNPNNPSGDVFSEEQLLDILQFAYRKNLHVISNEIYALSVFNPEVKFTSVLSIPHPDPSMVHVIWGCSKDLGLAGYKFAIVHTRNPSLLDYCISSSVFTTASTVIQHRLNEILSDTEWLSKVFLPTKHLRMLERYKETSKLLTDLGVKVRPSGASMFIWMDLSKFLPEKTFEAETALFLKFLEEKVFIQPGKALQNVVPGMFRVVFTLDGKVNNEGISRLLKVIKSL